MSVAAYGVGYDAGHPSVHAGAVSWAELLARHFASPGRTEHDGLVRVVVVATRGSAPREAGACMLVGASAQFGTIGGGHLEYRALEIARELLARGAAARLDRFTLGATLGQCCGGAVELWFERWSAADLDLIDALRNRVRNRQGGWLETSLDTAQTPRRILHAEAPAVTGPEARTAQRLGNRFIEPLPSPGAPLWLFGAGHVGAALVRVLAGLPFAITWIDNRPGVFAAMLGPDSATESRTDKLANAGLEQDASPALVHTDDPAAEVRSAPPGTHYLIMTHDHDLDYAICKAVLARLDAASIGLIGSATKAARFRHRLAAQGVAPERLARLNCPIGSVATTSKLPTAIAVSVAAQLLEMLERRAPAAAPLRDAAPARVRA